MIEEQATVIDIKDGRLMLQAKVQSSCGSCQAKSGCGTSLLSEVLGKRFTHFTADNAIDAQIGDEVIVGIPERSLLSGSFMVYLLPVLSMLLAALLADAGLAGAEPGRDLLVALSAASGFAAGALLARAYFRQASSKLLYTPVVLRKIITRGRI